MEQLKKCPFCGGEAKLEQIPSATWDKFVVTCNSSKCCAFYIGYCDEGLYETKEKAITAWNTRKPMERIVERLRRKINSLHNPNWNAAIEHAIEIVKEEMG